MDKSEAYKIVFDDLTSVDIFNGTYNAATDNDYHFMFGIKMVMDYIAYSISEECYNKFSNTFLANIVGGQEEADEKRKTDVV